ncbi:MAG: iron-containing alcohol dehydrogenase [Anaerolineae bacterium]|nr:iron-containing alcohol dehydrogenase [Anaerolineae bacterium]
MHTWPLPKIEYCRFADWEERRPAIIVTTNAAWDAVSSHLHLPIETLLEAQDAAEETWQQWDTRGEVVYAVGGGLAADAAKYVAARHKLPLICLPTALTVDAFLTWASGVRRNGCVYYVETKPPDTLVIDFEILGRAPAYLRGAGVCDTLSIATGSWDWRFAHQRGKNPPQMAYLPYADQIAQGILQGTLDCAEAAGRGDREGLKQLLDCLALEVQLCNLLGHPRPEEGSEHYFAYSVENTMGKGLPHGDLVGPGIVLIAALQGQDVQPLKRALQAGGVPLNRIPETVIDETLRNLPAYAEQHGLPYGIAHTLRELDFAGIASQLA